MSVEAVSWALSVPVGGNAKIVLLGLANHAHPDGSEAYPSLRTLSKYANCDPSTVRRQLRFLVVNEWIEAAGKGPAGQTKYRLLLGSQNATPLVQNATPEGVAERNGGVANGYPQGVAPVQPEPSTATVHVVEEEIAGASKSLAAVMAVFAESPPVYATEAAVENAIRAYPDGDHVLAAREVKSWVTNGKDMKIRNPGSALMTALGKQKAPAPTPSWSKPAAKDEDPDRFSKYDKAVKRTEAA